MIKRDGLRYGVRMKRLMRMTRRMRLGVEEEMEWCIDKE